MNPRIFISCVTKEFGSTRQRIANILIRLGYEPVWQDVFGTEAGDLREVLRSKIDGCQGLIHLVGHGYGFEPPVIDPYFGRISYTQFEFLHAQRSGKKTWLIFPGDACKRDQPLDQLEPSPEIAAERQQLQKEYRQRLINTGHLRHSPSTDTGLDLLIEKLRDEYAELRRSSRRSQSIVLYGVVFLVLLTAAILILAINSRRQNADGFARIEALQKRDAPGSELLAEYRQRSASANFSSTKGNQNQQVLIILAELAQEHRLTADKLREKILSAASGAREVVELAGQFRGATEYEAAQMRRIERNGHKDLGTVAEVKGKLEEALSEYQTALKLTQKREEDHEWAIIKISIGLCHWQLGTQTSEKAANEHLSLAVKAYRESLTVLSHERFSYDRAVALNNLSLALGDQAERSRGNATLQLLKEAEALVRESLPSFSGKSHARVYSMALNNLGSCLIAKSKISNRNVAALLLTEAASAFTNALVTYQREKSIFYWTRTQCNLATTISELAKFKDIDDAVRNLHKSVSLFREILPVLFTNRWMDDWATAQNNMGAALLQLSEIVTDRNEAGKIVQDAEVALREALKIRRPEKLKIEWASTQGNLGNALQNRARLSQGVDSATLSDNAVAAYDNALTVFTKDEFPWHWASMMNSMGNVLRTKALFERGTNTIQLLKKASTFYHAALEIWKNDVSSEDYAMVQLNLGDSLSTQAKLVQNPLERINLFEESVTAFRQALAAYSFESSPGMWAQINNSLGSALAPLGALVGDSSMLSESVELFRSALRVRTIEKSREEFAMTQYNMAVSLMILSGYNRKEVAEGLLRESIAACKNALLVYTAKEFPDDHKLVSKDLAQAEEALRFLRTLK